MVDLGSAFGFILENLSRARQESHHLACGRLGTSQADTVSPSRLTFTNRTLLMFPDDPA
jgi:hypothetical protein